MRDYKKIEKTHLLSSYVVKAPHWNGVKATRMPFSAWSSGAPLPWYDAYNITKHDRHSEFEEATFEHLIDACCGLLVILSSQFETEDFSPGEELWACGGSDDGMESGIGGYFRVKFPTNWQSSLQYDFNWHQLRAEADPFQNYDYS